MTKVSLFRMIAISLLVLWCVLIFVFSSQNAEKSSATSDGLVSKVIDTVYPEYKKLSEAKQQSITDAVTHTVRKSAHFFEYFVLGILSFGVTVTFDKYKISVRNAATVFFCAMYAVSDEIHQYFVSGRACRFTDMLIDIAGSLFAVLILTLIFKKIVQSG